MRRLGAFCTKKLVLFDRMIQTNRGRADIGLGNSEERAKADGAARPRIPNFADVSTSI